MSIDLGKFRRAHSQHQAAKKIAEKVEKQRKKEGFFGGLMSLLTPVFNIASKGLMSTLGFVPGVGILAPFLTGIGTSALKGMTESIARGFGAGGDPSKITAENKYGYGKDYAETLSEGLAKGIKERSGFSPESVLSNIAMQYVSELTPKLTVDKSGKLTMTKPTLPKEFGKLMPGGEKAKLLEIGDKGLIPEMQSSFYPKMEKAELTPLAQKFAEDPEAALAGLEVTKEASKAGKEAVLSDYLTQQADFAKEFDVGGGDPSGVESIIMEDISKLPTAPPLSSSLNWRTAGLPEVDKYGSWGAHVGLSPQEVAAKKGQTAWEEVYSSNKYQQGGQVPTTIADFFEAQGKSLGGNSKKSVAEMLGRR